MQHIADDEDEDIPSVQFETLNSQEAVPWWGRGLEFLPSEEEDLLQLEQLNIEYECGIRRNDPRVPCGSICHIWSAGDLRPLAQAHL